MDTVTHDFMTADYATAVPQLTTALTGPRSALEMQIARAMPVIERWFGEKWQEHNMPFYSSVDLRNSSLKIAPVDTNLYPGGFNNLNRQFDRLCTRAVLAALEKNCPGVERVLLVPENHTRNLRYMQNVAALFRILVDAGMQVRIGSLLPDLTQSSDVQLESGERLAVEPVIRSGNRIGVAGFDPDLVLMNNDLSAGLPPVLQGVDQLVVPPLHAGWYMRRKSNHFAAYRGVAAQFAETVGIDPWLIDPYFAGCGAIDFQQNIGEERLADTIKEVLDRIRAKYREYGIDRQPFVIVKADSGTYGMAVMTVKDPAQVRNLNRRDRKKMEMRKGHVEVHEVIVQEGIHSIESVGGEVAEPVIYMIDQFVVGAFYRACPERGVDQNLNVPGSHFIQLQFETPQNRWMRVLDGQAVNRFYAYAVVARLAAIASAIELTATDASSNQWHPLADPPTEFLRGAAL